MGAGTRILAGCGCLGIVAAVALVAVLGLGLFWLKDRAVDLTGSLGDLASRTDEIEEWAQKANAHTYIPPRDGVIPEDRLVAFLAVRRDVHEVYERHRVDLQELRERTEGADALSPGELLTVGTRAVRMYGDLRLAQVRALAEKGMSEKEYYALQTAVYVAAGVSKAEEGTGRRPSEAVSEAAEQIRKAIRLAVRAAQREGVPGADRIEESDVERVETGLAKVGADGAEVLSVPEANVELFRRHQAEIQRYAMHGLTLLGL